jgi:sodium-dependent dicarboxylate transporter 2/3/5
VVIFFNESIKEIMFRLKRKKSIDDNRTDRWMNALMNRIWTFCFREKIPDLKAKNRNVFVSVNRLIYDLPFFGLIFMGCVSILAYVILLIGDNPATSKLDGYLIQFFENISVSLIPQSEQSFFFIFMLVLVSIFLTEILNNTAVLLIMLPLVLKMTVSMETSSLIFLLAVTIGASGAFMTPIATSVNAIAFASIPGVSLKKMLKLGFWLNILGCAWLAFLFYLFIKFF